MENLNEKLIKIKSMMKEYSLSQSKMAEKIKMNESTFKLKFNDDYPKYKFKPSEIIRLLECIQELGEKIKEVA